MSSDLVKETQCRHCKNLIGPGTDRQYRCKNRIGTAFGIDLTDLNGTCINFDKREDKMKEAMQVFSIKNQTISFNDIQPLFYDSAGCWWLWDSEMFKWKLVDKIDITKSEIVKINKLIKILEDKIFLIQKIYKKIPCGGYGKLLSKEEFLAGVNYGIRNY